MKRVGRSGPDSALELLDDGGHCLGWERRRLTHNRLERLCFRLQYGLPHRLRGEYVLAHVSAEGLGYLLLAPQEHALDDKGTHVHRVQRLENPF